MSKKFIPNGDLDFVNMAESFARVIAKEPARFGIAVEDAGELTATVRRFREAHQAQYAAGGRSPAVTATKEASRLAAETIVRRLANQMRVNPALDAATKLTVGLRERPKAMKSLTVPNEAPRLKFVRAIHEGGGVPEHELSFYSKDFKPKPPGATRLELFVDLISPDEKVPENPGGVGRPIYLRSYTKSPIRVMPPLANVPMRVIYWARWADSAGNVGPMCATVTGWIEGGTHHLMTLLPTNATRPMRVEVSQAVREEDVTVVIALRESQRGYALPEPGAPRQLEGPAEAA